MIWARVRELCGDNIVSRVTQLVMKLWRGERRASDEEAAVYAERRRGAGRAPEDGPPRRPATCQRKLHKKLLQSVPRHVKSETVKGDSRHNTEGLHCACAQLHYDPPPPPRLPSYTCACAM
ncbi:unnamed protein product [Spodoptera exigua]|nr:unnamed protein product [Spodoptera exigua]